MGEWMYNSTYSWPGHCLQFSGQLHSRPPYSRGKEFRFPLDRRLGGLQNLDDVEKRKILPLPGPEVRPISHRSPRQVAIPNGLIWLHSKNTIFREVHSLLVHITTLHKFQQWFMFLYVVSSSPMWIKPFERSRVKGTLSRAKMLHSSEPERDRVLKNKTSTPYLLLFRGISVRKLHAIWSIWGMKNIWENRTIKIVLENILCKCELAIGGSG
jgi:hypothetical protein